MISVSMLPDPKAFCGIECDALNSSGSFCCEPWDNMIPALRALHETLLRATHGGGNASQAKSSRRSQNRLVSKLWLYASALLQHQTLVATRIRPGRNIPSTSLHPP
jgi:hypothetical protein